MKVFKDDLLLMKDFGRGPAVLRRYFEDDLLCNEGIWKMTHLCRHGNLVNLPTNPGLDSGR